MVGILIIAHGNLGKSFICTASHVLGKRPARLAQLEVADDCDTAGLLRRAQQLINELDEGSGVLVLTDICGATPCNVATRMVDPGRVEVISGLSLPMLLRALTYRNEPLATLAGKALSGGVDGVIRMQQAGGDATKAS